MRERNDYKIVAGLLLIVIATLCGIIYIQYNHIDYLNGLTKQLMDK